MAAHRSLPELLSSCSLASSSSGSRLLDLPAEMRIMILTILLAGSGIAKLVLDRGKHQEWLGKNKWAESESNGWYLGRSLHQHSGQMLRVSRQLYNEGLPILYGGNKFDFTAAYSGIPHYWDGGHQYWGLLLKKAIGEVNVKFIRHMLVKAHLTMPALTSYLPNLQSVELHRRYASDLGRCAVFEKVCAEGFQKEVERIVLPREVEGISGLLREDKGVQYSLVLNVYECHLDGSTNPPQKLVVIEANLSLREDEDNTEGELNEWRKLNVAKVKVWRLDDGELVDRHDSMGAGHFDLTACFGLCCGNTASKVCSCCVNTLTLEKEEPEAALHEGPST